MTFRIRLRRDPLRRRAVQVLRVYPAIAVLVPEDHAAQRHDSFKLK
jgi:hypothetical protein